jgi:hypothetical protein
MVAVCAFSSSEAALSESIPNAGTAMFARLRVTLPQANKLTDNAMANTFYEAMNLIHAARLPQDIFGDCTPCSGNLRAVRLEEIKLLYHKLSVLTHPDKNQWCWRDAHDAFTRLGRLYDEAKEAICAELHPKPDPHDNGVLPQPITWTTRKHTYTIVRRTGKGGMCAFFEGLVAGKSGVATPVLVKVPHSAKDNDLMEREARAFGLMKKMDGKMSATPAGKEFARKFALRVPTFLETISLEEPGSKGKKSVNAFVLMPQFQTGWHTLEEIRRAYPQGIDTRIAAFIWNRMLEALTFAHHAGLLHCAVTPNHVLIHAESHMGQLIDWTASCRIGAGDKIPYADEGRFPGYFPPEVLDPDGVPGPSSDIYMSAWCMVYLLGGDPGNCEIPDKVEEPVRTFLNRCLQPKRARRPKTAEIAFNEFREISTNLFGARKFVEFIMPKA